MKRNLKLDQSPVQLRRRVEAFRKLATVVVDGAALKALEELAAELEARRGHREINIGRDRPPRGIIRRMVPRSPSDSIGIRDRYKTATHSTINDW
jgi:hypothetical protein